MREYNPLVFMEFEDFCNVVKDNLGSYMGDPGIEMHLQNVTKNNGVKLTGIVVAGNDMAPVVYLESYYERYRQRENPEALVRELADTYRKALESCPEEIKDDLLNPNYWYENVYIRVVNFDKNRETLSNMPYQKVADLAVTMRVLVSQDVRGMASLQVDYGHIAKLELSREKLFESAIQNTERMFPVHLEKLSDLLSMQMGEEIPDMDVYILTNETMTNGASVVLYAQKEMDALMEKNGCSFYVIPSSIHEMLLYPDNGSMTPKELQKMVKEINREVVSDSEILSDSVYRYDKEKGLMMATPGKEREQQAERGR